MPYQNQNSSSSGFSNWYLPQATAELPGQAVVRMPWSSTRKIWEGGQYSSQDPLLNMNTNHRTNPNQATIDSRRQSNPVQPQQSFHATRALRNSQDPIAIEMQANIPGSTTTLPPQPRRGSEIPTPPLWPSGSVTNYPSHSNSTDRTALNTSRTMNFGETVPSKKLPLTSKSTNTVDRQDDNHMEHLKHYFPQFELNSSFEKRSVPDNSAQQEQMRPLAPWNRSKPFGQVDEISNSMQSNGRNDALGLYSNSGRDTDDMCTIWPRTWTASLPDRTNDRPGSAATMEFGHLYNDSGLHGLIQQHPSYHQAKSPRITTNQPDKRDHQLLREPYNQENIRGSSILTDNCAYEPTYTYKSYQSVAGQPLFHVLGERKGYIPVDLSSQSKGPTLLNQSPPLVVQCPGSAEPGRVTYSRKVNGSYPSQIFQHDYNTFQQHQPPNIRSKDFKRRGEEHIRELSSNVQTQQPYCPTSISAPSEHSEAPKSSSGSGVLEDFKNYSKLGRPFELRDIYGQIVEFSGDQTGSRFIQTKMDAANSEEKNRIFNEILPNALPLMLDVYGNYIVQKFFELGEQCQKRLLASKMRGQVVMLSNHVYGCRAVQKALKFVLVEDQIAIVKELENNVMRCVRDQNGNHVVQAAIEHVPPEHMPFIINSFIGQVRHFSMHTYGCRVVQRLLQYWTEPGRSKILEEVFASVRMLISDQFGNYVVQYVLDHESEADRQKVTEVVMRDLVSYSKQKFASNVVEKCIEKGDENLRLRIMRLLLATDRQRQSALVMVIRDEYGNYVIQKLLDKLENKANYDAFVDRVGIEIASIRRLGYNKQAERVAAKMHRPSGNSHGANHLAGLGERPPARFTSSRNPASTTLTTLLPTPPSTTVGSRSSSTVEEGKGAGETARVGTFAGDVQTPVNALHHPPFELSAQRP